MIVHRFLFSSFGPENALRYHCFVLCCIFYFHFFPLPTKIEKLWIYGITGLFYDLASSAVKWQDWAETSSQLEAISSLAAHVHITTSELLTRTYGELARHLVTPRLFTQCLAATQSIALKLRQDEMVNRNGFSDNFLDSPNKGYSLN